MKENICRWRVLLQEKLYVKIFCAFAIIMFGYLTLYSLVMSAVNERDETGAYSEIVNLKYDSICTNMIGILLMLVVMYAANRFACKMEHTVKSWMYLLGILLLMFIASICWINICPTIPEADQADICKYADLFNKGDFTAFERGQYVGMHRHQLGLITFVRFIFMVAGSNDFRYFQYVSVGMTALIILSGYGIVDIISKHSEVAKRIYLLILVTCIPLYLYVPFVYGEIPSTAMVLSGAYLFLSNYEKCTWWKPIGTGVTLGLAVQLRKNTIIIVMAFLLVLIIQCVCQFRKDMLILLVCILVGVVGINVGVSSLYQDKIPEDSHPAPSLLYVAMGTNDQMGWWDGYNFRTYEESNYDPKIANEKAIETIKEYWNTCKSTPGKFADDVARKINAQWNAPMYQGRVMTANFGEAELNRIVHSMYFGRLGYLSVAYMNIYQLLLYFTITVWLVQVWKKSQHIENVALLIGVFGGFLFTIIWEAKTRYVFPYLIIMLPYMAVGLETIITHFISPGEIKKV